MLNHGLYAITPSGWAKEKLLKNLKIALEHGVSTVQFREKTLITIEKLDLARAVVALCKEYGVPCIINDEPELVKECGAAGIHVGQNDMAVKEVRNYLGMKVLIGASCYGDRSLAEKAINEGADYVAFGSIFPSTTKPNAPYIGVQKLQELCSGLKKPCVAIGGINSGNVTAVYAAGAHSVAVIAAIFEANSIELAVKSLLPKVL
ncbi:MAG: thiamine phosphate synthase [Pseudomonadota bacterium]